MIKLRVKVFLLGWAYHWAQLVDSLLGIVTFGLVDRDLSGRVIDKWQDHKYLLMLLWECGRESWDDPDDPSDLDIDYTIFD